LTLVWRRLHVIARLGISAGAPVRKEQARAPQTRRMRRARAKQTASGGLHGADGARRRAARGGPEATHAPQVSTAPGDRRALVTGASVRARPANQARRKGPRTATRPRRKRAEAAARHAQDVAWVPRGRRRACGRPFVS
jgi:hypothetical protein